MRDTSSASEGGEREDAKQAAVREEDEETIQPQKTQTGGIHMLPISLKDEVIKSLDAEWPAFAARHPNLARVIDRTVVVEQAVACIGDTPEYRDAMEAAALAGATGAMLADIVARFVRRWLTALI